MEMFLYITFILKFLQNILHKIHVFWNWNGFHLAKNRYFEEKDFEKKFSGNIV